MNLSQTLLSLLILFLLSIGQAHSVTQAEELPKRDFKEIESYLDLMGINEFNVLEVRILLVELAYQRQVVWQDMEISRAGKFGDELLIEAKTFTIHIPEYYLLTYLNKLENIKHNLQEGYFRV